MAFLDGEIGTALKCERPNDLIIEAADPIPELQLSEVKTYPIVHPDGMSRQNSCKGIDPVVGGVAILESTLSRRTTRLYTEAIGQQWVKEGSPGNAPKPPPK